MLIRTLNAIISLLKRSGVNIKGLSDGYHTFEELYNYRAQYNAAYFNALAREEKYNVHKSWKHHDGNWCFGQPKEWFIVVAELPEGPISNHYKANMWGYFNIPEYNQSITKYDGHTPKDALSRLSVNNLSLNG